MADNLGRRCQATVDSAVLDPAARQARFQTGLAAGCGALASFTGLVRATGQDGAKVDELVLEHYPAMTERHLARLATEAWQRWDLLGLDVAHRHGRLLPGEVIVHVLVAAAHRRDAFAACEAVVERLKHEVPFWKKEVGAAGGSWVRPVAADA